MGDGLGERNRRDFDWNLLHTFATVVQEGSITRAAEKLSLRQPTVSNSLKRLEEQLHRRLIDRGAGRFEPTEHGAALYRECREICGSIGRLHRVMEEPATELSGELQIYMASHVVFPPLDETLTAFHHDHPSVTFVIDVATSADVIEAVQAKHASLGICLVSALRSELDHQRLFREHFGFFCGPRHRLFGHHGLTVADLHSESLVSFKTDRLTDALRPVAALRAHCQMEGPVIGTSSNLEEVRRMIIAGLGIGPLPIHVVERDVQAGLLWRLPPFDAPPAIDIYLVTHPRAPFGRAERAFLELLLQRSGAGRSEPLVFPNASYSVYE